MILSAERRQWSGGERADASRRPLRWLVRRPFDLEAHSMS